MRSVRVRGVRLPHAARRGPGLVGLVGFVLALGIALFGPLLAPESPTALVGAPFSPPSGGFPLGTDQLGRDVLSRVLNGGRSVVLLAGSATLIAFTLGAAVGLVAGYVRGWVDTVLMRATDVLLAFPPILLMLVLATGAGASPAALVAGVVAVQTPGVARVVRTATLETVVRGYVEAAVARGERTPSVLTREVLPNIWGPIVADGGPRFTASILLVAAVNFLGLGLRPPAADWALMIAENRTGLTLQPWSVVAPALLIATLTIAVNLLGDALARTSGRSLDIESLRR
jgi:peptide/nickel transport system permease protein